MNIAAHEEVPTFFMSGKKAVEFINVYMLNFYQPLLLHVAGLSVPPAV